MFFSYSRSGTNKLSGKDHGVRESTLIWESAKMICEDIHRHSCRLEFQLCVPKEDPSPLQKKIDVTRTPRTTFDVLQESRMDNSWNIDVNRNFSTKGTAAMDDRKTEARQCAEIERHVFIDGNDGEFMEIMKSRGKSWNCSWRQPRSVWSIIASTGKIVAIPTNANQSMHASSKLTNLRESVWKELSQRS